VNRVAVYCRLSDEDRNKTSLLEDSESIQNQKTLLARYVLDQGWALYRIYSDEDYSGLDKDRPEWNRLLKDAEAGKFDIVLCKSQSRFTRDMELVERYLHCKFVEWGIRFIGLTDHSDTWDRGNKKQRQILGLTNEWYCEDVSENIRAVLDAKRKEGKFIGSFACYGYKKDPEDRNRLVVDEAAALNVRRIFDWYLEGYGTHRIASMLNEGRVPSPAGYKRDSGLSFACCDRNNDPGGNDGSGLWSRTTVKRILTNELYAGNMVQGKRRKVNYKSKKIAAVPANQWYRVENTHEPIIEKRIFAEVRRRMGGRQRSTREGQTHLFAAKVRCADCGGAMNKVTAFRGNRRLYSYLRCKKYATAGSAAACTSHSIRMDLLRDVVAEKLRECIRRYLDENSVADGLETSFAAEDEIERLRRALYGMEKQLLQSARVLKSLYLDRVEGRITEEQFAEWNQSFSADRHRLAERKEELERRIAEISGESESRDKRLEIIRQHRDFEELTHTLVAELIDYIEVGEKNRETGEQTVKIHWAF
jgi:DNA invertase Pin-like site-specific DNA recombinase